MRNIFNLLITAAVFWVGNEYFKEYISIADTKTLILATVFMFVLHIIYAWILLISTASILIGVGCLTTPVLVLAAFVFTPIKLWLLSTFLPGFHINGFWTYILISVIIGLFSISKSQNNVAK